MSFFTELKRRNVFRVAIAYGVVAWLVAQVLQLVFESFGTPDWVMKTVLVLMVAGLLFAIFFSWTFEMTSEGLRRETSDPASQYRAGSTSRLDRTIIIALVAAVAYFAFDKFVLDAKRDAAILESVSVQAPEPDAAPSEPAQASIQSIAVLPFVNMSDDPGNEYFADGLAEELLNILVKIPELRVAARTSSFSFKDKDLTIAEIAARLNVSHVLEGSVRKSRESVRITAQLIKADDGFRLWSKNFDRKLDDIFAVQDEIAIAVVSSIKAEISGGIPKSRVTHPEAYTYLMQGRYFENLKGAQNWRKAETAYQQALSIDSNYAPAWVAMGSIYDHKIRNEMIPRDEGLALAMSSLNKALNIDGTLAEAIAMRARLKSRYQWDWEGAQADIEKAIKLEPNNAQVVSVAGQQALILGQLEIARIFMEKAVTLDPVNLTSLSSLGRLYLNLEQPDNAIAAFSRVIALNPQYPWIFEKLGRGYLQKGDIKRAVAEFGKYSEERLRIRFRIELLLAQGKQEQAQIVLDQFIDDATNKTPLEVARAYVLRGDHHQAFEWLDIAYVQRDVDLAFILVDKAFFPLRDNSRWANFLQKMNLLEYWLDMPEEYGGPPDSQI